MHPMFSETMWCLFNSLFSVTSSSWTSHHKCKMQNYTITLSSHTPGGSWGCEALHWLRQMWAHLERCPALYTGSRWRGAAWHERVVRVCVWGGGGGVLKVS
jgi:hypothetical protein